MKKDIHPAYYNDAKIICACGAKHTIGSTQKEIRVEICSHCHPFYTGKQKLIDSARRVDKFQKRLEKKVELAKIKVGKRAKRVRKAQKTSKKEAE